nr:P-selectin-like isoform X2 [Pseudochaenichthys georgianus]
MRWILILFLGSSLALSTSGWTYHPFKMPMNWAQARQWCQSTYTDMVVIQNQRENDYLVSMLPIKNRSPYYWIGVIKHHKNDPWTWIGNNSTWVGEHSWAANEPNNNHSTEFCVEIYVNRGENRGKWNDEKCNARKYPLCYKAQCNETSCERGRCQETINNMTCLCEPGFEGDRCQTAEELPLTNNYTQCNETSCERGRCQETINNMTCLCEPGFEGDRCQTAEKLPLTNNYTVQCPPLPRPDNGYLSCFGGNLTFNSTCRYGCNLGFLILGSPEVTCEVTGVWSGPRPTCAYYKQALLAVAGSAALSVLCCLCFCCMKRRKRKKLAQPRQPEEVTSPFSEGQT